MIIESSISCNSASMIFIGFGICGETLFASDVGDDGAYLVSPIEEYVNMIYFDVTRAYEHYQRIWGQGSGGDDRESYLTPSSY